MSSELTHNQVLELLPAYALGALEPEEMLAVDSYLAQQRDLLAQLRRSEQAAAQLARTAPAAPLPGEARERLMARVRVDIRDQTDPAHNGAEAERARPAQSWLNRLGQALGPGGRWAVAAGAILLLWVLTGLYTARLQGQVSRLTDQLGRLQAQVTDLQAANNQLQQQAQADRNRLALIADAIPGRTIALPGTAEAPGARGTFYPGESQGLLLVQGLAPLAAGQTYQLWLIPPANRAPVPAGLVEVQAAAPTWLTVDIPPAAQDFAAVGVSIEPAGGSPAPTGPIVLLGSTG